jgi:hypothetical protein
MLRRKSALRSWSIRRRCLPAGPAFGTGFGALISRTPPKVKGMPDAVGVRFVRRWTKTAQRRVRPEGFTCVRPFRDPELIL